uniref:Uncharacterized protein n=1 Tax=Solanum tuberosum TaxID=4113 RepID=M1DC59_SOLTU
MSSGNHGGSQGYVSPGNHGGSQGYGRGNSQVDQTDYQRGMTVLHEQYNQILTMLGQTNVHGGTEGPSTSYSSANLAQEYPTTVPIEESDVSSVVPVLKVPAQRKSHRISRAPLWL